METIIANRIRKHYKETNFLSPFQHGFRSTEGVDELLALLRLRWAKFILRKHQPDLPKNVEPVVHAIFLDIRKLLTRFGMQAYFINYIKAESLVKHSTGYETFYTVEDKL